MKPSLVVQEALKESEKAISTFDRRIPKRIRKLETLDNGDMCDPFPSDEETTGQYEVPPVYLPPRLA